MFYEEDHIMVTRNVTTDGIQLKIGEDGRPVQKVFLAPLSAKKHFEERNKILPQNLKVKIDVIHVGKAAPAPVAKPEPKPEVKAATKAPKEAAPVTNLPKGVEAPPALNF